MGFFKPGYNFVRHPHLPDSRGFWITLSIAVPIAGVGLTAGLWGWLNDGEPAGTTIRNVGLIIAALTALPVAIWRGVVADKQSAAAQSQADAAQQSLRNERYQKGAEMLGHESLSVRLGGTYALQRLAEEFPEEYHVQITGLFSAFTRHPTADEAYVEEVKLKFGIPRLREDVQAVVRAIGRRNRRKIDLEREEGLDLDLTSAYLTLGDLREANLAYAILTRANLSRATLTRADFRSTTLAFADLRNASLEQAVLYEAKLVGTKLSDAILSRANLSGVIGLTQEQLDETRADPDNPPKLDGALDSDTGKPLVWKGKPLKD